METGMQTRQSAVKRSARLCELLDTCIGARGERSWPVSLAITALSVRQQMPDCDLDNRDLTRMIAIHAVERGRGVIFDADLLDHT